MVARVPPPCLGVLTPSEALGPGPSFSFGWLNRWSRVPPPPEFKAVSPLGVFFGGEGLIA